MNRRFLDRNFFAVLAAFSLVIAVALPGVSARGHFIVSNLDSLTRSETLENTYPKDLNISVELNNSGIVLKISIPNVQTKIEDIDGDVFYRLTVPGCGVTWNVGKPQLPVIRRLLAVPPDSEVGVEILDAKYSVMSGYNVYPAQEPLLDLEDNFTDNFTIDEVFYSSNDFYTKEVAEISSSGWLRDFKVVTLNVYPVQFNPASKQLKVHSYLEIKVEFNGTVKAKKISRHFESLYESAILNYHLLKESSETSDITSSDNFAALETMTGEGADYLIIAEDNFYNGVQPLANWKREKGLKVKVTTLTDIWSWAGVVENYDKAIRDYIKNAYENWDPAPSYVLLVGDVEDLPTHYGTYYIPNVATDHYYSCLTENDYFSDVFVGRISVKRNDELRVIVNKIIGYENNPYLAENWYRKAVLIADHDVSPYNFEETKNWVYGILTANGYTTDKIYEIDYYQGEEFTDDISAAINDGRAFVNYRGHGHITDWPAGPFDLTDVRTLMNGRKLPVVFSFACDTGDFDYQTDDCLGEAWLKAENGGVGFFGSTWLSSTEWNHELDKGIFIAIFNDNLRILGEATAKAKLYMYSALHENDENVTELTFYEYNILGDPELNFWRAGKEFNVTYTGENLTRSDNVKPCTIDRGEITPTTSGPLRIRFEGDDGSKFIVHVMLYKGGNVYGANDIELNAAQDGDYWIYQANYYDKIALIIARRGMGGNGSYTLRLQPEYGYISPPFKFSDVIDSGDASWASPYHVELRISTNPSLDQPEGEGGSTLEDDTGTMFEEEIGGASSNSTENSSQVQTAEENWVEVGRGRDYLTYRNQATGEFKQVIYPGPIHTWDGERWVSYVFENRGDYYQVQHPIASARFYPERTEFWDEGFAKCVVASEDWSVERLEDENWRELNFTDVTISCNVINDEEVQLVRTASSPLGTLRATYVFRRGSPVKITSEFTASEDVTMRFAWRLQVEGATSHQVTRARLRDLDPARYWGSVEGDVERDVGVSFFDGSGRSVANFAWWEEAENENLLIGVEAIRENLLIHFGDFKLRAGQIAILDPTFYSTTSDGEIWQNDQGSYPTYDDVHDAPEGRVRDGDQNFYVGQYSEHWTIYRGFVFFDTFSLPDDSVITSATLSLSVYPGGEHSERDFDIVVENGQPTYPHDPLRAEDYYYANYGGNGGSINTSSLSGQPGYRDIILNSSGRSWINKAGWTKFCLRSSRDRNKLPPGPEEEVVAFCATEYFDFDPKLTVTYVGVPPAPVLLSPDNGSTIYTLTPRLDWEDLTGYGVDRYWIQVKEKDSGTLVDNAEVSSSDGRNSKYDVPEGKLSWDETYEWHVRARNSAGWGDWSSWWEFTVRIPPVENAWVYWRYDNLTIDATHHDGSKRMDGPAGTTSGVWSADLPRPGPDNRGRTIYWRVKARASDGRENWSPVYKGGRITNPPYAPLDIVALQYMPGEPASIQLKFARPSTSGVARARLHLCANQVGEGWGGDGYVMRVDNQTWDESITSSEFDNQEVAEVENFEGKWISVGWDWVDVTDQLRAETGENLTLRLSWYSYEGWETFKIVDDNTLMLGTTEHDMYVTFYSTEALENWAWLEIIPPDVTTSIWPSKTYGRPGENLTFELTVKNNWVENDTFELTVEDALGWVLTLADNLLENVTPSGSRMTVITVTIPDNAEPCTRDNITVTATSQADPTVSDSASCVAEVVSENTFLLDLVAGWNLVGFPVVNENTTKYNLFTEAGIDPLTVDMLWYDPYTGYHSVSLHEQLKDNLGYWIKPPNSVTIKLSGMLKENCPIYLVGDWNLVSFPVVNENTTKYNLFTEAGIDPLTVDMLWYDPYTGYHSVGLHEQLKDNLGYYIKPPSSCTLRLP